VKKKKKSEKVLCCSDFFIFWEVVMNSNKGDPNSFTKQSQESKPPLSLKNVVQLSPKAFNEWLTTPQSSFLCLVN
jgi:hypothetical protein